MIVLVAGGNNKQVQTGSHPFLYARSVSKIRLVLILAGAVCFIFICFWYISTMS
jgi:hypothetical protein